MYNSELIEMLQQMPLDSWVDVMFPEDSDVFTITGVSTIDLPRNEKRIILDISEEVPLRAV